MALRVTAFVTTVVFMMLFHEINCIIVLNVFSSEGALYVIMPYDYPAQQHPLFEHTPVGTRNQEVLILETIF